MKRQRDKVNEQKNRQIHFYFIHTDARGSN